MNLNKQLTTYPSYQSPIRIFETLGISVESIDSAQLRMERKRLLLEIQISDTQTTQLGDQEVGKNDVIELFDRLENMSDLAFHKAIFKHPILLDFLENGTIPRAKSNQHFIHFDTKKEWDAFIQFISPYLAYSFDKLLSKVIRTNQFVELEKVDRFFTLLTPSDAMFAFRKFINFCSTLNDRLTLLAYKNSRFPAEETAFLRYAPFYNCVNKVAKFHPSLPDSVASDVINFTVNCERKQGRGSYLVEISDQLKNLTCSNELQTTIYGNREVFRKKKEQTESFDPTIIWRVIVGVFMIGFLIFRVSHRCESNRNYDIKSPDHQELLDQIEQLKRSKESGYTITTLKKGNAEFNEDSFLDFHEIVKSATEQSYYQANHYLSQGELPGIISRFKGDKTGSTYRLMNQTSSDMILLVYSNFSLNSYFVKAADSTRFIASDGASMFFYSGTNWKNDKTIEHWNISRTDKTVSSIRFNGYFSKQTSLDHEFGKKYFSLTDGSGEVFNVMNSKDGYQFYREDRFVNYSY